MPTDGEAGPAGALGLADQLFTDPVSNAQRGCLGGAVVRAWGPHRPRAGRDLRDPRQ